MSLSFARPCPAHVRACCNRYIAPMNINGFDLAVFPAFAGVLFIIAVTGLACVSPLATYRKFATHVSLLDTSRTISSAIPLLARARPAPLIFLTQRCLPSRTVHSFALPRELVCRGVGFRGWGSGCRSSGFVSRVGCWVVGCGRGTAQWRPACCA
jgi:hypothetical protein